MTFYDPGQLDPEIDNLILGEITNRLGEYIAQQAMPESVMTSISKEMTGLRLALLAARYHQRQFIWRWRFLHNKYLLNRHRPADSATEVRIDDLPLRFELQALLLAVDSSLDVTWRLISLLNGQKPDDHQKFRIKVEKHPERFPYLAQATLTHRQWFADLIHLRNAIAHEGLLEEFLGFGYRGQNLANPSVGSRNAQHFSIQLWVDVRQVVKDLILEALKDINEGKQDEESNPISHF